MNNFSKLCRTKKVSAVTRGKSYAVGGVNKTDRENNSEYLRNRCVNGSSVKFKVDTSSQANIIPWAIFKTMQYTPKLKPTKIKLFSYSGDTIPTLGCCKLKCEDKLLEFFVIETDQSPILSFWASEELGLIRTVMYLQMWKHCSKVQQSVWGNWLSGNTLPHFSWQQHSTCSMPITKSTSGTAGAPKRRTWLHGEHWSHQDGRNANRLGKFSSYYKPRNWEYIWILDSSTKLSEENIISFQL